MEDAIIATLIAITAAFGAERRARTFDASPAGAGAMSSKNADRGSIELATDPKHKKGLAAEHEEVDDSKNERRQSA